VRTTVWKWVGARERNVAINVNHVNGPSLHRTTHALQQTAMCVYVGKRGGGMHILTLFPSTPGRGQEIKTTHQPTRCLVEWYTAHGTHDHAPS
jgi:hypothetical protein